MFYVAADQTEIQSNFWGSLQSWPNYEQWILSKETHFIATNNFSPNILLWLVIICRSVLGCICAVTVPCTPLCWHGVWKQLNSYLHTFCHLGSASLLSFFSLWIKKLCWIFFHSGAHIYSQDTRGFVFFFFYQILHFSLKRSRWRRFQSLTWESLTATKCADLMYK